MINKFHLSTIALCLSLTFPAYGDQKLDDLRTCLIGLNVTKTKGNASVIQIDKHRTLEISSSEARLIGNKHSRAPQRRVLSTADAIKYAKIAVDGKWRDKKIYPHQGLLNDPDGKGPKSYYPYDAQDDIATQQNIIENAERNIKTCKKIGNHPIASAAKRNLQREKEILKNVVSHHTEHNPYYIPRKGSTAKADR